MWKEDQKSVIGCRVKCKQGMHQCFFSLIPILKDTVLYLDYVLLWINHI